MSIELVQARTAEISAQLSAMVPGAPPVVPASPSPTTSTSTGSGTDTAFAAQLQSALGGGADGGRALLQTLATTSAGKATPVRAGAASGDREAALVADAKTYLGIPYLWGGTTRKGLDCSGFTQSVYRDMGIALPRTAKDQARMGSAVAPADARPGDLVAMDNSASRAGIDHIGIYLGNGRWIAAPRTGDVVKVQSVDLSRAATIRRILPSSTAAAAASGAHPAWAAALPAAAQKYVPAFVAAGNATGVDPRLLASVAWTESNFTPDARSHAGAVGLMQLMPSTAKALGVNASDPTSAALGAARYLREQISAQGGRVDLALAAYNAGPGAVRKAGGIPANGETPGYVSSVLRHDAALAGTA